jgi:hypothetical protein
MYTRREFNKSEVALSNEIKSKLIEVERLLDKLPNCRELYVQKQCMSCE